jgi:hypothetical protein
VPNVPLAQKLFWVHPIELLGDVGYVESCFSPFGDGVNIGAREVHGLHRTYHRLGNQFGCTRLYLVLVFLEIVLDAPDGTRRYLMELLGDVAHVKSRFGTFRDGVSVRKR